MPMSTGTKRLLAVVVVVVVVVGVVGVYIVLQPPAYTTPGAPSGIPRERIIKIGILDPMTEIQGDSCWKGAYMAVREINTAGGITINGTVYYLGLIAEDTKEADPALDITKGVAAATKILTVDGAQFIIGGFRTESLKAYIETVMDKKTIFLGTGASTDYFTQCVFGPNWASYNRYKYFFRIMPINSSSLGKETITELAVLRSVINASALVRTKPVKYWAILRENLDWTLPMRDALRYAMPMYGWNATPAIEIPYPITATESDFTTYWSQINASKAQVVIPIISAQGGTYMMTQYNATKPMVLPVGIDVPSQLDTFWASTNHKAAYEVIMQPLLGTNKTPLSVGFWNNYIGNYTAAPLYTGTGAYDAVYTLAWAIGNCSSLSSDKVVTALETIKTPDGKTLGGSRVGAGGRLAFTKSHDLFEGYNIGGSGILWSVALWVQWHSDGQKYCITSGGKLYPSSIVTGSLQLPPWGLN